MSPKKIILILLPIAFLACAAFAETTSTTKSFPPELSLGGQSWKLGYNAENDNLAMAEYVTNGENVNNWNQLVTFQKFKHDFDKGITPTDIINKEIAQLNTMKNYKAIFNTTKLNDNEAIFEFRITQPSTEQQDELQRVILTPNRKLIILHYVIKKLDMGQPARDQWITALKNINVS